MARVGFQAIHDMCVPSQPVPEDAISRAPDVNMAVIATRHDISVVLSQEGDSLNCLAIPMACEASRVYVPAPSLFSLGRDWIVVIRAFEIAQKVD